MSIEVNWQRDGSMLVAALTGRIDSGSATDFLSQIEEGFDAADGALILDFEKVDFISSAGLRACLVIARRFIGTNQRLCICSLTQFNRDVIASTGFHHLLTIHESRDDAIQSLGDA